MVWTTVSPKRVPSTSPDHDRLSRMGLTCDDRANPDPRHTLGVRGLLRLEPDRALETKGRDASWPIGRIF